MEIVAIKVKIGLRTNGYAAYPDFNQLQVVKDVQMDWAKYVDVYGFGWHYDKTSGHKEKSADSPRGQQFGMLLVPKSFADQAVAMFPEQVVRLDETQAQDFYDNKSHIYDVDEEIDERVLTGIKLKQDLGLALTDQQQQALDPKNNTPGIRKNPNKKWLDFKSKNGIVLK